MKRRLYTVNIYDLTMEQIITYRTWLAAEEKSAGTIEKYLRDIYGFFRWLNVRPSVKNGRWIGKHIFWNVVMPPLPSILCCPP